MMEIMIARYLPEKWLNLGRWSSLSQYSTGKVCCVYFLPVFVSAGEGAEGQFSLG